MKKVIVTSSPNAFACGNGRIVAEDVPHFVETYNRAVSFAAGENVDHVEIVLGDRTSPRKHPVTGEVYDEGGWLEHAIIVHYENGGRLYIGAIQRKLGAGSEFHS